MKEKTMYTKVTSFHHFGAEEETAQSRMKKKHRLVSSHILWSYPTLQPATEFSYCAAKGADPGHLIKAPTRRYVG